VKALLGVTGVRVESVLAAVSIASVMHGLASILEAEKARTPSPAAV